MHPANEAEINKLPEIVEALSPGVEAVLADKGYASKSNRNWLKERGIGDLIQHKGSPNMPGSEVHASMQRPAVRCGA